MTYAHFSTAPSDMNDMDLDDHEGICPCSYDRQMYFIEVLLYSTGETLLTAEYGFYKKTWLISTFGSRKNITCMPTCNARKETQGTLGMGGNKTISSVSF